MKLFTGLVFCSLVLGVSSQGFFSFMREAYEGAKDMWRAYTDRREADFFGADKYFHAPRNSEAERRRLQREWAAKTLRDAREYSQIITDLFGNGDGGYRV